MAPEGTRSYRETMRSGYYYFAKEAQIKIAVAGMDFRRKRVIIMPPRDPLATLEEDQADLLNFCRTKTHAKYPELTFK